MTFPGGNDVECACGHQRGVHDERCLADGCGCEAFHLNYPGFPPFPLLVSPVPARLIDRGTAPVPNALAAQLRALHTSEDIAAEFYCGTDGNPILEADCPGEPDCPGHVRTIQVCRECGYEHDGDEAFYRPWPCPTIRAVDAAEGPLRVVTVPAVVSPRGVCVVVPAQLTGDNGVYQIDDSGTSYWADTAAMRRFADECADDPNIIAEEPWIPDLYRTLANLADRWETP